MKRGGFGSGNPELALSRSLTVGLTPSGSRALALAAKRRGVSKNELVRLALAEYLGEPVILKSHTNQLADDN